MSALLAWVGDHPDTAATLFGVLCTCAVTAFGAALKLYSMWKASRQNTVVLTDTIQKNALLESAGVITGAAQQIKEDVAKTMDSMSPAQKKDLAVGVNLAKEQWANLKAKYKDKIAQTKLEREKRKVGG
jgi:hypothetical protein